MEWLMVGTWIAIGLFVGVLHVGMVRDGRRGTLVGSSVFGAMMGGYLVRLLHLPTLDLRGYELGCLIGAAICAEVGALLVLGSRAGARPTLHRM